MSSICGIVSRSGKPVSLETIESMTGILAHWQREGDRRACWRNDKNSTALGQVMLVNTPESADEILPFHCRISDVAITADARIDNREELAEKLGIETASLKNTPDSQLILKAYQKWGMDCPHHLTGDFAFAIWDERQNRLFCARDPIGCKPFFYVATDESFAFATEMKGIFKACRLAPTLDPLWIADAITVYIADNEYTPYSQIRRLPPAHVLSVSSTGIRMTCYWKPDPEKEIRLSSEDEYIEAFRELLNEAVRCRTRSLFPLGSELSGGLDSSVVAALAAGYAKEKARELTTFSHVREENGHHHSQCIDERDYQILLRRHAEIFSEYSLSAQNRGIMDALRHSLKVLDGPSHRVYGLLTDVIHEHAKWEGIRTLLSGFGGDEVVTHPGREYVRELFSRKAWRKIWQELNVNQDGGKTISLKSLASLVLDETAPTVKRILSLSKNLLTDHKKGEPAHILTQFPINPDFFLSDSIRNRLASQQRNRQEKSIRKSQCYRLTHPSVATRLEICSIEAASRHLEYRYPLLDIRLVEFHLAVPSCLKRKNGYGRYLYRKAVEGIIPPEIQWRVDKTGTTVPAARPRLIRDFREIENLIRRSSETSAALYINPDQMLYHLNTLSNLTYINHPARLGLFINSLKLLVYFEEFKTFFPH